MTFHDDCRWVFTDCCGALIDADCDSTVGSPTEDRTVHLHTADPWTAISSLCQREEVPSGR